MSTIPKEYMRSLQDITTHSGRVDDAHQPYKAYMKIAALEMEKARRGKEKESALNRVWNIDERFKEIEGEKAEILGNIGETNSNQSSDKVLDRVHNRYSRRNSGGFKIRY